MLLEGVIVGVILLLIGAWWFDQLWKDKRRKLAASGVFFLALSAWPIYQAAVGVSRGRIDIRLRSYTGVFWRSTDGYEFWLAFGFWMVLALLAVSVGACALRRAIR